MDVYTLENRNGLRLEVIPYGAIITKMLAPDRNGQLADVALGFESPDDYQGTHPFFGCIAGRVANRIAGASFELDGKRYEVAKNDGAHHLHGGVRGWDKALWSATRNDTPAGPAVTLVHVSRDGDEGYPGTVTSRVTYTLTHENELRVDMSATTDAPTLVNLAQHSYWNLGGVGSGTVLDHELTLHAGHFTPGAPVVPMGEVRAVADTPFDFRSAKPIGRDLRATGMEPIGYDHNFVVDGEPGRLRPVARVVERRSGRVLELASDAPGVQFYTGNHLDGSVRGKGTSYAQHTGFCLETQGFPNAINVPAWRNQVILRPGQTYRHTMVHRFSTE